MQPYDDEIELFRALLDNQKIGIFFIDSSEKLTRANEILVSLLGFSNSNELLFEAEKFLRIFPVNKYFCSAFKNHEDKEKVIFIERNFLKKSGQDIVLNIGLHSRWDNNNIFLGLEGFAEDITYRKSREAKTLRRDKITEAISIAAEEFLQTPDLESQVHEALGKLGSATGADHIYIYQNNWMDNDDLVMTIQFEWSAPIRQSPYQLQIFNNLCYQKHGFYRWMAELSQNNCIFGEISDFLEEEQNVLLTDNITSILIAPIIAEFDWWGFIGFENIDNFHSWGKEEIDAIKVAASIFGAAFHRKNMELAMQERNQLFQTVADFTHDWEYWIAPDGNFIYSSPSFKELTGYTLEYLRHDAKIFSKITHPDDYDLVVKHIESRFTSHDLGSLEYRIISKDGQVHWISHVCKPVFDPQGKYLGQRASNRDVTVQKQAEKELLLLNTSLKKYVENLEQLNQLLTILNEMGGILQSCTSEKEVFTVTGEYLEKLFSKQSGALYYFSETQKTFDTISTFGNIDPLSKTFQADDCWGYRRRKPFIMSSPRTKLRCQHISISENEFTPYFCIPINSQDQFFGLISIIGEPTQEAYEWTQLAITVAERTALALADLNLRETLKIQSILDPLTNLYNRRFMAEILDKEIRRAIRQNSALTVAIIDIDYFKNYNDVFGHDAGDIIITSLGQLLKNNIRTEDFACRYGGDEFVLILPGSQLANTEKRINQLNEKIGKISVQHKGQILPQITVSIGIACFPEHGKTEEELLRSADTALYKAKDIGRNRIMIAEKLPQMET